MASQRNQAESLTCRAVMYEADQSQKDESRHSLHGSSTETDVRWPWSADHNDKSKNTTTNDKTQQQITKHNNKWQNTTINNKIQQQQKRKHDNKSEITTVKVDNTPIKVDNTATLTSTGKGRYLLSTKLVADWTLSHWQASSLIGRTHCPSF